MIRPHLARRALGCALLLSLALPAHAATERARWLMGTLFTFRAEDDSLVVGPALEAALDSVASLEARLSNWRASSELSRLNAAGGGETGTDLGAVLDSALVLAALTAGAFDPTIEAYTRAWDLRGEGRVPGPDELAGARARTGWVRVRSGDGRVDLGGTALDLGGIGKGFALDRAAAVMRAHGVSRAALDAGGQWRVLGGAACSVWVAHPADRARPAVRLALGEGSLATSAQSERMRRADGAHIGHVLDPHSGRPLTTRASVSVWAASGTRADALSTALLVMGRERARAFVEAHPGLGALWLEPDGDRVVVHAWNLEVAGLSPGASLASPITASRLQERQP